jgi:hypothetical protein
VGEEQFFKSVSAINPPSPIRIRILLWATNPDPSN